MTSRTAPDTRAAPPRRPGDRSESSSYVPVDLVDSSLIPMIAEWTIRR